MGLRRRSRLLPVAFLFLAVCPALGAGQTLVDVTSSMRYLANTTDPGIAMNWTAEVYPDAGWLEGVYGAGYENGSSAQGLIATYVPPQTLSLYTRATFEIDNPASVLQLFLSVDYDDAFTAWINGVEVYRSPELPGGTLFWDTEPSLHESSNGTYPDFTSPIDISAFIPQLHAGTNVLAIGAWNDHSGANPSSDFVLVPRLHSDSPTAFRTRGPYLQQGTDTSVVVRWGTDTATSSRVRFGASPGNLSNFADGVGLTSEHEVKLQGLSPDTVYYYSVGTTTEEITGNDDEHFYRTAPAVGTRRPLRIWAVGDSGTANQDAAAVRESYRSFAGDTPTDLWLMLGDNAYEDGTDDEYQTAVFHTYPRMLRSSVLWPTVGNHDDRSANSSTESGPYYDIFSLPRMGEAGGYNSGTEAYYSFDFANIHFICLNSADVDQSPAGAMMTWLEADLSATLQDWIIAFWHHPPYSKGSHNSDTSSSLTEIRENFLETLEDWGVDLVLTGHSHSYERSFLLDGHYGLSGTLNGSMKIDDGDGRRSGDGAYQKSAQGPAANQGAVYIVAGSSGKTSGSGTLDHPVMVESLLELGSMVLDVDGDRLEAKFLNEVGVVRDNFTLVKNAGVAPTADFAATPVSGLLPLFVDFTDASTTNTAEWVWDLFGNGSTDSVQQNPTAVYVVPGQYDVVLTAANDSGSDQEVKTAHICVSAGAPPEIVDLARLDASTWSWSDIPGANAYDLIRGDLLLLKAGGGDFASSILACVGDDAATSQLADTADPPHGQGWFYLVRGESCDIPGSFDSAGTEQAAPRDIGIASSGMACP